jgi:hypothetical protein
MEGRGPGAGGGRSSDPRRALFNVIESSYTMDFDKMTEKDVYLYVVRYTKAMFVTLHSCRHDRERADYGVDCADICFAGIMEKMLVNKRVNRQTIHILFSKIYERYATGLPDDYPNDPDESYLVP